jgi:hypothetical protein
MNREGGRQPQQELSANESTVEAGEILKVTSGELSGYDVFVLSVNEPSKTARVALAVFGGTDHIPFEIELGALARQ